MIRDDLRAEPVRKLIIMGESNVAGGFNGEKTYDWAEVFARLMQEFQSDDMEFLNKGISSNVISPDSPMYNCWEGHGSVPSAIERFREDVINHNPDMVVYAYGLNDSRCGHPLKSFLGAYESIIRDTREALPDSLLVLVSSYWNLQYDAETWSGPEFENFYSDKANLGGDQLVRSYNEGIRTLAAQYNGLFVNVYLLLEGATWLLNKDYCHFNEIGSSIIGHAVLGEVASRCSFLSNKFPRH
jgi:lysophospholipase L1-like esterase